MNHWGFHKIWIIILVSALIAGGVMGYQYFKKGGWGAKIDTTNWQSYQNNVFNYSLKYPAEQLKIEEDEDVEGETVVHFKAKEALISNHDAPGIEIKVSHLDDAWHLKQSMMWIYGTASQESSSPPVGCENCEKNVALEDVVIAKRIEAIKMYNKEGVIDLYPPYRHSFFFTTEDRAFLISFIQPENYPSDYLPIFHQILSTFKIL